MNFLKIISFAAVAAMSLMAVAACSASATTLEIGGVAQSGAVTLTASAESSLSFSETEEGLFQTCSGSHFHGSTTVFSGTKVTGSLGELNFTSCIRSPVVVNSPGKLYVEWESGTTSGTVFWEGADLTMPSLFGFSVTCTTSASETTLGTLDGKASGTSEHATLTVSAILSCGLVLPSVHWSGTYKVTSPTGLGVVA
ncbi:MAG TPA: hypothetical protein VEP91_11385 [Solirubrobacterales bacterium]|nr:hypothetical protein [Solirubrobacterales bacterium]